MQIRSGCAGKIERCLVRARVHRAGDVQPDPACSGAGERQLGWDGIGAGIETARLRARQDEYETWRIRACFQLVGERGALVHAEDGSKDEGMWALTIVSRVVDRHGQTGDRVGRYA